MTATFDAVMREFEGPLANQSGCRIECEVAGNRVLYVATLELRSSFDFAVERVALRHATDAVAYLRELADTHLKPNGERIGRAAAAASSAWTEALRDPAA